jgi:hypothetical protein
MECRRCAAGSCQNPAIKHCGGGQMDSTHSPRI